ncbi:hypothetical protein B0H14DRAFT_2345996 [Mycena olivaceomarginata]|nr:hypothetical protein B0H14DRAFT_2345996 [Mycena olivaceomarginata]
MMIISLIAPELTLGFAARQYVVACWFARSKKHFFAAYYIANSVSLTHAFFLVMGGFVTRDGHHPIVIRAKSELDQYLERIREIKEEDIEDKSKGDNLSKLLTVLQVIWFVAHCIVRNKKDLPISPLETATVGFAFIHICTSGFWRKKPRNVSEAILLDPVSPFARVAR